MTRGVWHSWGEKEAEIVKTLRSLPELIRERNSYQELLNTILPSIASQIREIPISGQGENTTEHKVHKIIDIRIQMQDDIDRRDKEIYKIMHMIDGLAPDEQTVLNKMYFQNKRVYIIAQEMHFSEKTIYRLRSRGIAGLLK